MCPRRACTRPCHDPAGSVELDLDIRAQGPVAYASRQVDLDLETLDLLQEMLADYPGTVLLVSHDRDFIASDDINCVTHTPALLQPTPSTTKCPAAMP